MSVLLYRCETWKTTKEIVNKLQTFVNRCLRNILRIWWPKTISNTELWKTTQQIPISSEIKMTKWKWIGHILRKDQNNITRKGLDWNPQGERRKGRPRVTWKRTVSAELQVKMYRGKRQNKWQKTESAGVNLRWPYVPPSNYRK
jgi:hypothetical protein